MLALYRRTALGYTQPTMMGTLTFSDKIFQRHLCLELLADALFTARLLVICKAA